MEEQMHQATAGPSKQLSNNPLLGPGQITAASGRDHKRVGWGYFRAR
jgi:hypothetical protein